MAGHGIQVLSHRTVLATTQGPGFSALLKTRYRLVQVVAQCFRYDRPQDENNSSTSSLVFSFKYFREVDKLKSLVRDIESDIKSLCGDIRVIFAMKKHQSIGNLVVRNRKLSSGSEEGEDTSTQKCGSKRCKLCPLLFDVKEVMVNGQICKFDMKLNCKSDNVLYLNQCQVCPEYEDSYFGQTVTEAHIRMNGHRNKFDRNDNNYEKSALAFHCHDIHPDIFCLDNFRIDIGPGGGHFDSQI